ncbi:MAG: hypothetical protein JRE40_02390 [Deltaproteobacteria bacterium]|nr:hypothetical protein [Deltaproteobacteria bacterium]
MTETILQTRIQPGTKIPARSACDYDTIFWVFVISRTKKMATIVEDESDSKPRACKIHTGSDGVEFLMPDRYNMAPVYSANRAQPDA